MASMIVSIGQYLPAAALIALPNLGGALNTYICRDGLTGWMRTLKKPWFSPPEWIFAPAWTCIFMCMGVSSYLVYKEGGLSAQALPLGVYGVQFLLNFIWSPIYFKFHRIDLALLDIIAMWGSIAATMVVFYPISRTATLLLLPHFLWISFATCLNYASWKLNGRDGKLAIKDE